MIKVTTLDKRTITVNCDLIERLEEVPETVITLVNGKKFMVQESMDEIIELVVQYRRNCQGPLTEKP
ncbi:MAG TPA: flagellar FlbD family protein [Clostridia bacterium]|nr:flagellar FlbD family protein [Clostridia bacterium]